MSKKLIDMSTRKSGASRELGPRAPHTCVTPAAHAAALRKLHRLAR